MRQNFWYCKRYTMYNSGLHVYFYDSLQDISLHTERRQLYKEHITISNLSRSKCSRLSHSSNWVFYIRVSRFKQNNWTNFSDSFVTNRPKLFLMDLCSSQQLSNLLQLQHFVQKTNEPIEWSSLMVSLPSVFGIRQFLVLLCNSSFFYFHP